MRSSRGAMPLVSTDPLLSFARARADYAAAIMQTDTPKVITATQITVMTCSPSMWPPGIVNAKIPYAASPRQVSLSGQRRAPHASQNDCETARRGPK